METTFRVFAIRLYNRLGLKSLLIFHSDPIKDSCQQAKEKLYDPRVRAAFNKTAWADGLNLKD